MNSSNTRALQGRHKREPDSYHPLLSWGKTKNKRQVNFPKSTQRERKRGIKYLERVEE